MSLKPLGERLLGNRFINYTEKQDAYTGNIWSILP